MSPRRLLRALWTWRVWIPVALILGPAWTAVHEGAHALAAISQGGELREWSIVPGRTPDGLFCFGYVYYSVVSGEALVLLAPTIASFLIALPASIALRHTPEGRASRFAFLMAVLFPIADISLATNALVSQNEEADMPRVVGGSGLLVVPLLLAALLCAGLLARPAFERHFRTGFTVVEYVALGSAVLFLAPWAVSAAASLLLSP